MVRISELKSFPPQSSRVFSQTWPSIIRHHNQESLVTSLSIEDLILFQSITLP